VDGDGTPDVVVPGLPADESQHLNAGRGDTSVSEMLVDERPPPTASVLDPMGRIEQQGYALQSAMMHPGWRRTVVKTFAFAIFAALVAGTIASIIR